MKIPATILSGSVGILLGMAMSALTGWGVRHGWWFVIPAALIGLAIDLLSKPRSA